MGMGLQYDTQRDIARKETSQDIQLVTAATVLLPNELYVHVTTPGSSSYALTFPPAALCRGKWLVIRVLNTGGGEVSMASNAGDAIAVSVGDNLSAAGDYALFFCTGEWWQQIAEKTT